uniref:Uncharacterized protein n=1 Tax=Panagrolaimus davidi TaxID=227884 RepID=A0A914QE88_9BILA
MEATKFNSHDSGNIGIKRDKLNLDKPFFPGSIIQNPFEFPRQQKGDQNINPKLMQFKANQKLLVPISSSKNARLTHAAGVVGYPAQMPALSNHDGTGNIISEHFQARMPNLILQSNLGPVQSHQQQQFYGQEKHLDWILVDWIGLGFSEGQVKITHRYQC